MGVISTKHQTMAKVGKGMLWVLMEGKHTLQWILRAKIANLFAKQRKVRDYAWIVSPDRTKPIEESAPWNLFVVVCICLKKLIIPKTLACWEERHRLPLLVPNMACKSPSGEVSCHQVHQKML